MKRLLFATLVLVALAGCSKRVWTEDEYVVYGYESETDITCSSLRIKSSGVLNNSTVYLLGDTVIIEPGGQLRASTITGKQVCETQPQ
jgi:hypothetical protein